MPKGSVGNSSNNNKYQMTPKPTATLPRPFLTSLTNTMSPSKTTTMTNFATATTPAANTAMPAVSVAAFTGGVPSNTVMPHMAMPSVSASSAPSSGYAGSVSHIVQEIQSRMQRVATLETHKLELARNIDNERAVIWMLNVELQRLHHQQQQQPQHPADAKLKSEPGERDPPDRVAKPVPLSSTQDTVLGHNSHAGGDGDDKNKQEEGEEVEGRGCIETAAPCFDDADESGDNHDDDDAADDDDDDDDDSLQNLNGDELLHDADYVVQFNDKDRCRTLLSKIQRNPKETLENALPSNTRGYFFFSEASLCVKKHVFEAIKQALALLDNKGLMDRWRVERRKMFNRLSQQRFRTQHHARLLKRRQLRRKQLREEKKQKQHQQQQNEAISADVESSKVPTSLDIQRAFQQSKTQNATLAAQSVPETPDSCRSSSSSCSEEDETLAKRSKSQGSSPLAQRQTANVQAFSRNRSCSESSSSDHAQFTGIAGNSVISCH